jgi:uncharacterized membrane protein
MSFAASFPPAPQKPVAIRKGSSRWLIAGLLVLAAMPLTFGVLRLLQLAELADAMPPAVASPVPLILHIVGALLYAILGAFQFSASIRRRWPLWHRAAGRTALVGALLVALSALWLTGLYVTPSLGGLVLAGFRIVVVTAMLASIVLGVAAVLRRDIARHREWMIRAYALGLGAATQMLVLMVAEMISGGPPTELNRALLSGLAWGINVVIAEWSIRRG